MDAAHVDDDGGPAEVEAAGGVVWRPGPDGGPEVLLVHRPRYDDWSLPKGKLDPGEDHRTAALREILEETGVAGVLGADLGEVRYADRRGRSKRVRWWAVRAREVNPRDPDAEVDELRWLDPPAAADLLSHPTDRAVLVRFAAAPPAGDG